MSFGRPRPSLGRSGGARSRRQQQQQQLQQPPGFHASSSSSAAQPSPLAPHAGGGSANGTQRSQRQPPHLEHRATQPPARGGHDSSRAEAVAAAEVVARWGLDEGAVVAAQLTERERNGGRGFVDAHLLARAVAQATAATAEHQHQSSLQRQQQRGARGQRPSVAVHHHLSPYTVRSGSQLGHSRLPQPHVHHLQDSVRMGWHEERDGGEDEGGGALVDGGEYGEWQEEDYEGAGLSMEELSEDSGMHPFRTMDAEDDGSSRRWGGSQTTSGASRATAASDAGASAVDAEAQRAFSEYERRRRLELAAEVSRGREIFIRCRWRDGSCVRVRWVWACMRGCPAGSGCVCARCHRPRRPRSARSSGWPRCGSKRSLAGQRFGVRSPQGSVDHHTRADAVACDTLAAAPPCWLCVTANWLAGWLTG